jgi:hypothetical protein
MDEIARNPRSKAVPALSGPSFPLRIRPNP